MTKKSRAAKRAGRKRKQGERYASGDLKPNPTGSSPSGALWQRFQDSAVAMMGDARLATPIGRLVFNNQITPGQAAVADRFALIYGFYERDRRHLIRPRSARSASYERGLSGSAVVDEEFLTAEQLQNKIARERASLEAFQALQEEIGDYPYRMRAMLEEICVDGGAVADLQLPALRWALDRLVSFFGRGPSRKRRRRRGTLIPHATTNDKGPAPREEIERSAQEKFIRALRPDLDDDDVARATAVFTTLRDRERERRTRPRAGKDPHKDLGKDLRRAPR